MSTTRHSLLPRGRYLVATLGVGLAASLVACGDGEKQAGTAEPQQLSDTEHNGADVAFATVTIPHHAEALVMVDLTQGRALDPEVQRLVEAIRATQTPEVETMAEWLVSWGEEVPATIRDHANADHGGEGHDGDLGALEDATDAEFQTSWLELMVEHHEDSVEMAREAQTEGRYRPAVELADRIVDTQTEEIETMQELLES